MKAYQKVLGLVLVLLVTSACVVTDKISLIIEGLKENLSAGESIENPRQDDGLCAELDLTPEECSNLGTHTYEFVTEFPCNTAQAKEIEEFIITFSDSSVELHKIIPAEEEWTQQFDQISENEYLREVKGEPEDYELILDFLMDGFTVDSTLSDLDPCGKYIRTIVSDD